MANPRILNKVLESKIMPVEEVVRMVPNGATLGMSGFTGAGYPKAVPVALVKKVVKVRLEELASRRPR